MKLSIFALCMIYALFSVSLGVIGVEKAKQADQDAKRKELKKADRTKTKIMISPQTGKVDYYTIAADQIEDGAVGKRTTDVDKSDLYKAAAVEKDRSVINVNVAEKGVVGKNGNLKKTNYKTNEALEDVHSVAGHRIEEDVEKKQTVSDKSDIPKTAADETGQTDSDKSDIQKTAADKTGQTDSNKSETPKTAAGEMSHGLTGLTDVEKAFFDNFKKGVAGHWIDLRNFSMIQIANICKSVYQGENGKEAVAHYMPDPKLQEFKVQLNAEEVETLMTDVLQCKVETIEEDGDEFKTSTFYVAEGNSPKEVYKLKKTFYTADDTLKVYGKADVDY